jgi:TatA/E family protein of Tat protein translocase
MIGVPGLLLVLVVLLLVVGTSKLPKLAHALGDSKRELEKGLSVRDSDT